MPYRSFSIALAAGVLATLVQLGAAHAQALDDEVAELSAGVIENEYADGKYRTAKKKLQRALKRCGKRRCSSEVKSAVYRDLGAVHLALGDEKQAAIAFRRAVKLDESGQLRPDVAAPEVNEAFERAGGTVAESEQSAEESDSEESDSEESDSEESDSEESDSEEAEIEITSPKDEFSRNWVSLSFQQDFMLFGETRPACGNAAYTCFAGDVEYAGPIWPSYGNQVSAGLSLATTRILLGFDHVFGENVALGVRLGYAFRGGPSLRGGDDFLPAHAELRMAYHLGAKPFVDKDLRPYLGIGGGLADVRSGVDVDYYEDARAYNDARKQTLEAWRKAGRIFVAPTLGTQLALDSSSVLTLELRWMVMLGTSGSAPAASLGFAQGF